MNSLTRTNSDCIRVGTITEAQERYRFGRNSLMNIAEKCGAVIRYGRSVRLNFEKLDMYFDSLSATKEGV